MFHLFSFSHSHGCGILSSDFIPSLELEWRKKRARSLTLKIWHSEPRSLSSSWAAVTWGGVQKRARLSVRQRPEGHNVGPGNESQ